MARAGLPFLRPSPDCVLLALGLAPLPVHLVSSQLLLLDGNSTGPKGQRACQGSVSLAVQWAQPAQVRQLTVGRRTAMRAAWGRSQICHLLLSGPGKAGTSSKPQRKQEAGGAPGGPKDSAKLGASRKGLGPRGESHLGDAKEVSLDALAAGDRASSKPSCITAYLSGLCALWVLPIS